MTRPLLAIEGLTIRFRGNEDLVTAVDDISFRIHAGEILGLVGESGSGKSLSALSVVGLTPDTAEIRATGGIRWRGRRLDGRTNSLLSLLRGRRIAIVFQEPAGCLNPIMTIGRQIGEAFPRKSLRWQTGDRISDLLAEVGLASTLAERYPHELSGGQQQRAMIAMALAGDPSLLIADEPTTALDVTVQAQIVELLRRLCRSRRMALLFISHDLPLVGRLADRIAVMRHGRIVEHGLVSRVFAEPEHAYTKALLDARPDHSHVPSRLATVDGPVAAEVPTRPPIGGKVLAIEGLTVDYPGRGWLTPDVRAVSEVSLDLGAGETLGIVGESGSGKSTIGKAIVGLVPAKTGRIVLFGEALAARRPPGHRRCQIVFQDSQGSLNPRLTVARNLGEPLDIRGLATGAERRPRLEALMAEVRLGPTLLDRYPHELSGGQRQRVNIARALALDPELLICDEIVSALDVTVQAQVLNLLKDIQCIRGLSMLFISHDLAVVRFMADRIAVMKDGRIVEIGRAADILDRPEHPYTRSLMSAIPRIAA